MIEIQYTPYIFLISLVIENDQISILYIRRSLQKDFTLAAFTAPLVNTWREFLENPLPDPNEIPVWPLLRIGPYLDVPLTPTLTEKERELIAKFAEKQHEYKKVNV